MPRETGHGEARGEAEEPAIEVVRLHKRFGEVTALAGISFTVRRGEPTTGIDVASARQVRQLIGDLHRAGTTIFNDSNFYNRS